eukprot:m.421516 g.421516  ORF g.421516 m.421516 type:complete len:159 (-) comp21318_c2_seq1:266-742(-)
MDFLRVIFAVVLCAQAGSAIDGRIIEMNDSSILYSPYNWVVSPSGAKTINPGAYFRVVFTGQSCTLLTDTTASVGPFSQFWTRIDGGPLEQHVLAPGNPAFTAALGPPFSASNSHLLEVIVKSTTETQSRWAPQSTAVIFTGVRLDAGATVSAPRRKP